MIVQVPFEAVGDKISVSAEIDGEMKQLYIVYVATNIEMLQQAIAKARTNAWVVGVEYRGSMENITSVDTTGVNVYSYYSIQGVKVGTPELTEQLKLIAGTYPNISVIVNTDEDFMDMRFVVGLSDVENLRFSGGYFLRTDVNKFGAIPNKALPKPLPESKIAKTARKEGSIYPIWSYADIDVSLGMEECPFKRKAGAKPVSAKKTESSSTPKEKAAKSTTKKTVSSVVGSGTVAF